MAKGANSTATGKSNKKMKLDKMPTEELKKWALAYGMSGEAERDELLEQLVRIMEPEL